MSSVFMGILFPRLEVHFFIYKRMFGLQACIDYKAIISLSYLFFLLLMLNTHLARAWEAGTYFLSQFSSLKWTQIIRLRTLFHPAP